jgi:hypothetical protein
VLAGWEGTAHDALVLRDALERENGLRVPQGNRVVNSTFFMQISVYRNITNLMSYDRKILPSRCGIWSQTGIFAPLSWCSISLK